MPVPDFRPRRLRPRPTRRSPKRSVCTMRACVASPLTRSPLSRRFDATSASHAERAGCRHSIGADRSCSSPLASRLPKAWRRRPRQRANNLTFRFTTNHRNYAQQQTKPRVSRVGVRRPLFGRQTRAQPGRLDGYQRATSSHAAESNPGKTPRQAGRQTMTNARQPYVLPLPPLERRGNRANTTNKTAQPTGERAQPSRGPCPRPQ